MISDVFDFGYDDELRHSARAAYIAARNNCQGCQASWLAYLTRLFHSALLHQQIPAQRREEGLVAVPLLHRPGQKTVVSISVFLLLHSHAS